MKAARQDVRLDDVCGIASVLVDPRKAEYQEMIHVGGANIESATGGLGNLMTAREEELKSGKFLFDDTMVLYSKIRPYLMKVARPDFRGLCSADIYPLSPDRSQLDRDYLFYLLLTTEFTDFAIAGSARAGMPKVNRDHLFGFRLSLPPLPEQRRIVGILDEAFGGIATAKANAEKNLQNARALFESHLQSVFTHRGPGWAEKTVDQISTNLDSKRIPITKSDRKSGKYPYYGASGIVDHVAEYIFEGDALLVSEDGANLLMRSTPIAFSVSGKYWVNNHAHILRFANMPTQRFVEFYLGSIRLDEYIRGAAQPKLTQTALNAIPIPIPEPVEAQGVIVRRIELLSEETQRLASIYQQKLAALDELKKSLLHQAFTGQL